MLGLLLLLNGGGSLGLGGLSLALGLLASLLGLLVGLGLAGKSGAVVRLEPLTEGGGVDLDNAVLDEGLGPHKLVGGGVVHDVDETGLAGDGLRAPGEVAGLKAEGAELLVSTAGADSVDPLGTELGQGRGASSIEVPLLDVLGALSSGGAPLVARITSNT